MKIYYFKGIAITMLVLCSAVMIADTKDEKKSVMITLLLAVGLPVA